MGSYQHGTNLSETVGHVIVKIQEEDSEATIGIGLPDESLPQHSKHVLLWYLTLTS